MVRRFVSVIPLLFGLCFLVLAACEQRAGATISEAQVPALKPGLARVWFVRGSISPNPSVQGFSPMIYVNGAQIAPIRLGTVFYRDFAPGTYRFTVQTFGLPTNQATTLQLASGTVEYLNVDWVGSWTQGYPNGGWGFAPNTFAILTMSTRIAQAYLPTLAYLGER
jgi:hypothetical protein